MQKPLRIAIVGGGWAGLAAAIELCQHGHTVSVYESSPQLGGRARSIEWKGKTLDNGQHLMIGAYQQMLSLLNTMQVDINGLFKRLPHHMLMLDSHTGDTAFELKLPTFPAPLHLLFGVLRVPQLSLLEKIQVLLRFNKLLNTPIVEDINVCDWLASARLPKSYTQHLLEPVCLAALTTHPAQASARAFQSVLLQTFNAPADHTDLLIPTQDLGQTFPAQARQFIEQHGGKVLTRCKVQSLQFDSNGVSTINVNDEQIAFDHVILATPPTVTAKLLADRAEFAEQCASIQQLQYEPVTTLYLQFTQPVILPTPMIGLLNGLAEWVFERATSGHADILAVVISAQGEHLNMPQAELVQQVYDELERAICKLPELIDSKLIIEKRATIQCSPGVDKIRPGTHTPLSNLNLCGDYVYIEENNRPGLPSTLEGALRSGVKCAQHIIQQTNPKD
jgi:hydroxysqualene dehydroxylase